MQLLKHFKELSLHPKNAEELKGLILQLAIQGKLTVNWRTENPDVKTASVLLKEVDAERIKRLNGKTSTKRIVFEDSEKPFELPRTWLWAKLENLSFINGGFAFKSSKYVENGARVIRISDFDENGFKNHKVVRYDYSDDLAPYVLENNNILIAMTGGTVGKSLFTQNIEEKMVVNQRVATIKIIKPLFEAYINCVIPTKLVQDVIEEAKNSTNDNISMSDIKGFNIPVPPLEEQKAIVQIVNELFTEVEQLGELTKKRISLKTDFATSALQRITQTKNVSEEWNFLQKHFSSFFTEKANIKKLRETILQLAVQGKLTAQWRKHNELNGVKMEPATELLKRIEAEKKQLIKEKKIKKEKPLPEITEEEMPYELPEGWVWCRLGDLISFLNGYAFKSSSYVSKSDYQIIRLGNVKNDRFLIDTKEAYVPKLIGDETRDYQLFENDILVTLTGTKNRRDYSFTCLVKSKHLIDRILLLNQRVGCIRTIDKNASEIVNKFLKSDLILDQIFETETGTANQGNIGSTSFKNLVFPLPPKEEQQAIVEKVNALMALCDELEGELVQSETQMEDLMKSCLREVFEGEEKMSEL